jgi:hypothetical protein
MTATSIRVRVAGHEQAGRAVDLVGADVSPGMLVAAVRDGDDDRVRCPSPGPVHEHVGLVDGRPGLDARPVERRVALAAVARSRGERAPSRDRIDRLERQLADLDPPAVDVQAARERVARAGADVAQRRERVAALRGRVEALREADEEAAAAEAAADLADAATALSEAETERAAAEQALDRARERAREARHARERRLELEDRLANARREARATLADAVRERVAAAVVATPGARARGLADVDPVTARLALARVARLDAPVVLAARRFPGAAAASDWIGAPVVRV